MIKKFFALTIVSTLFFIACSSDNSTAPSQESALTPSSSSILSSTPQSSSAIQNANDVFSSSSVAFDTVRTIRNDTVQVKDSLLKVNVTCEVSVDTDSAFSMKITIPNSITMTADAKYKDSIFTMTQTGVYPPETPQSQLDNECDEAKADNNNLKRTLEEQARVKMDFTTKCEGNIVALSFSALSISDLNPIPVIAAQLTYNCDEIIRTGVLPTDDE